MIETILKNFIDGNTDHTAYFEIPKNIPDTFFVIEKLSGSRDEQIDSAMMAVQTYSTSMYNTASLCETLNNTVLDKLADLPEITKVTLNSSYNHPDTAIKRYRYQSVFEIYYYGGNET